MNNSIKLFEELEEGLTSLRVSRTPPHGSYSFHDMPHVVAKGMLIKLAMNSVGTPSLWIGSSDLVTSEKVVWESKGIKASQSPDGSGATSSWIVIEAEKLYTDGIFISLATSICAKCIDINSTKRGVISDALDEWRQMFLNNTEGLNLNELAGLIGELITLEEIAKEHGASALETWHGFEGERHDFSRANIALETKTKTTAGAEITINGLRQLETPSDGKLMLRLIRLEATTSEDLCLPAMIKRLCALGLSQGKLEEGILKAKASPQQIANPTKYFHLIEKFAYKIEEGFPRIIPASFETKQCPPGVGGLKYQINIGHAERFKASESEYILHINQL